MGEAALLELSATEALHLLRTGQISPLDALEAVKARVDERDGAINAIPIRDWERARRRAEHLTGLPPAERGVLGGLPIPIKDLTDVAGMRSTMGSPLYADRVPTTSDLLVERIEARGGVVFGKSNTPEFGAGANTFNEVFGATVHPLDNTLTVGGSSGGAAAALAAGMSWIGHGSDLGGSLRTPAAFCGVCGLRPTPGRVSHGPSPFPYVELSVEGPMARNISDLALTLEGMAGGDPRDPLGFDSAPGSFLGAIGLARHPLRLLVTEDAGCTPVDLAARAAFRGGIDRLANAGAEIIELDADYRDAKRAFQTLRALQFALKFEPLLKTDRDKLKPEIIGNAEAGLALSGADWIEATAARSASLHRTLEVFERHRADAILCPGAIVPPFPVGQRYVAECDGKVFETYMDWLAITYIWSVQLLPVVAMPAGTYANGLPHGFQVVGRPRDEAGLLATAAGIERLLT